MKLAVHIVLFCMGMYLIKGAVVHLDSVVIGTIKGVTQMIWGGLMFAPLLVKLERLTG